jgi:hypothetical protein
MIKLIEKKKLKEAHEILSARLKNDCLALIWRKDRHLTARERVSVFDEAFMALCLRVENGKFVYKDDKSFVTYFKTSCVHQVYKIWKLEQKEFSFPGEILENLESKEKLEEVRNDFIQEKIHLYGIKLVLDDNEDEIQERFDKVMKIFNTMDPKCQLIIWFKFFEKLSHEEIVEVLESDYKINSADTSKQMLCRCLNHIRIEIGIKKASKSNS